MSNRPTEIRDRTRGIVAELPQHVSLVAAAKTRAPDEVRAAIEGGACIIGHNYVQEAAAMIEALGSSVDVSWQLVGHLQRNKVKQAVRLFDAIQTVDSLRLARAIDTECAKSDRLMPILIEVNSGRESQKAGVAPDEAEDLVHELAGFEHIRIEGLMTMGPFIDDPERLRPLFAETKTLLDRIADLAIPNVSMTTLSMGMSDSYRVAIEEGATMVRLGAVLFGPRGGG